MPVATAPAPPKGPPYLARVSTAVAELKQRNGASLPALSAYLAEHYGPVNKPALSSALKKGVADGALVKVRASYKLSPQGKVAAAKAAKVKGGKKKPVEKKAAPVKKPVKKAASVTKKAAAGKPKKTIAKKAAPEKKAATKKATSAAKKKTGPKKRTASSRA